MKIILLFGLFAVLLGQQSPYYSTDPEDRRYWFLVIDNNQDDSLTRDELIQVIQELDRNGDGSLNITEYNLNVPQTHALQAQGEFRYYDKLDGTIDGKITDSMGDPLMNILDSNKDGRVTLAEFQQNIGHVVDSITREIDGIVG